MPTLDSGPRGCNRHFCVDPPTASMVHNHVGGSLLFPQNWINSVSYQYWAPIRIAHDFRKLRHEMRGIEVSDYRSTLVSNN